MSALVGYRSAGARILVEDIRLRWVSLSVWCVSVAVTVALVAALYPSISSTPGYDQVFEAFPPELKALFGTTSGFGTATGYLSNELFGFFLPAIVIAYAIGRGAGAIAGEEEGHTLDLLMAQPVSRGTAYTQKAIAVVIGVLLLSMAALVPLLLLRGPADLDIEVSRLAAVTAQEGLLALVFGAIALSVSVAIGRKGPGIAVAGGLAFLTYLLEGLGRTIDWLDPWRVISPWHWYSADEPLSNGMSWTGAGVLVGMVLVIGAAGLIVFERRNLHA